MKAEISTLQLPGQTQPTSCLQIQLQEDIDSGTGCFDVTAADLSGCGRELTACKAADTPGRAEAVCGRSYGKTHAGRAITAALPTQKNVSGQR